VDERFGTRKVMEETKVNDLDRMTLLVVPILQHRPYLHFNRQAPTSFSDISKYNHLNTRAVASP
jgi:hypothetical protein